MSHNTTTTTTTHDINPVTVLLHDDGTPDPDTTPDTSTTHTTHTPATATHAPAHTASSALSSVLLLTPSLYAYELHYAADLHLTRHYPSQDDDSDSPRPATPSDAVARQSLTNPSSSSSLRRPPSSVPGPDSSGLSYADSDSGLGRPGAATPAITYHPYVPPTSGS
eukprot:CAMPEP_0197555122 /NCGR_PEP_ID=MMETSP1320-20131121/12716_1 /TAXON_ID=91990 /ORGANISM="Bolidomonas sp., Strain RCC2347" /LENGTH=165 /DNA_ID=CAMNT_0043116095 /DNA_START=238 /DNA_END=731 /DNA_ORIENTATION=+